MRNVRPILSRALVISVALLACLSCSRAKDQGIVPAGPLMAESIHFQYAVYYLPRPSQDPSDTLARLIAEQYSKLVRVDEMQETPSELLVCARMENQVQDKYAPPDIESLQYFGRGLTQGQAQDLQESEQAFILDFGHPRDRVWEGLRTANGLAETLARETGGLLWDEETRQVFSPDEWHKKRIASWTEDIPAVLNHTTIHAYSADKYVRAITLGMSKIGLPDVVVDEFSWSMDEDMGHLINLFCQSMAEGPALEKPGEFDLDLRAIQNQEIRDAHVAFLESNATGVAFLTLREGKWEEGDPPNRLIEITFDRHAGRDVHSRQGDMLSSLFGWEDSVVDVTHTDELLAASEKAKAQLPDLRQAFAAGLQPGEFILVKAPFQTPDGGHEWMWVEVTAWRGNTIQGLLQNEPFSIPTLHAGQVVQVKQEDVFDYLRVYPDGRQEGNETGTILQRMEQEQQSQ